MNKTFIQFDFITNYCKKLFEKKFKIYGCSWRLLNVSSIADQILIKINRMRNIFIKKIKKIDEDISDDLSAIINYSVIGLIQIKKNNLQLDMDYKKSMKYYNKEIEKAKKIMEKKNYDYGESWKIMNFLSIIDIILQKILRIKQVEKNNNINSSIKYKDILLDNYLDIINYAVILMIKIDFKNEKVKYEL